MGRTPPCHHRRLDAVCLPALVDHRAHPARSGAPVAPPRRRPFDPHRRCALGRSVGRSFRLEALRSVVLDCLVLVCLGQPGRPPRASSHAPRPARLVARGGAARRATQCAHDGGGRVHPRRQPGEFDPKFWGHLREHHDRPLVVQAAALHGAPAAADEHVHSLRARYCER